MARRQVVRRQRNQARARTLPVALAYSAKPAKVLREVRISQEAGRAVKAADVVRVVDAPTWLSSGNTTPIPSSLSLCRCASASPTTRTPKSSRPFTVLCRTAISLWSARRAVASTRRAASAAVAALREGLAQIGLIHRDVKPANILLTRSGQVKLADLGLAKVVAPEATTNQTATGVAMGTPRYMAPAQFADASRIDHRDRFAFERPTQVAVAARLVVNHEHAAALEPRGEHIVADVVYDAAHGASAAAPRGSLVGASRIAR